MLNRILVITDDPADANMLKGVLGRSKDGSFAIKWVRRLATGLKSLRAGGYDAIVVDLSLPDSSGIATFDRLYAAAPHTPVVTLSAGADDSLAIEAVQHGAQGYLTKGYFVSHLVPQMLRNIIQRKAIELAYYQEKERAEIALNSISDAVICTDIAGNVDYLNIAAETMTGWSREDARGRPVSEVFRIIDGDTREPAPSPVELVLLSDEPMGLHADTILIRRDGKEAPVEDSASPIHDWDGQLTGVVIVFHDVSAAKAMTMKMAHLAHHDFLTDLPNRVLLNDRIAQAIALAKRNGTQLAVLFLDLDNFKLINDTLGHASGDQLLQSVAQRLRACVRSSDTVSRVGGDEFVILLSGGKYGKDAELTADKILAEMARPHAVGKHELQVTLSIGISVYPADGQDAETLIRNADTAMYTAKEKGRANYQFFGDELNIRALERQVIEANLRLALVKHEFVLHYQPKVNLADGRITGAEALLRWKNAELGMMTPERFISIAEECGLIVPIGRWVLHEACLQAQQWGAAGLKPGPIAVNISALEFRQHDFVSGIRAILENTGLDACRLQLEITESALMRDAETSAAVLRELKDMGVQLAVDDFGTGYSSLSRLQQFPIDILKIDQTLVHGIGQAADDGVVVSAVIGMGNSLRLQVEAEGVENSEQLAFLRARHCAEGQGYIFSRPLNAAQFAALLTDSVTTGLPQLPRESGAGGPP